MEKIFAIIRREYLTRVKSRAFLVWTILTPLLGAMLMLGPTLFAGRMNSKVRLVILDQSGDPGLFARVAKVLDANQAPFGGYELLHQPVTDAAALTQFKARYSQELSEGKWAGYLIVPPALFDASTTTVPKLELHIKALRDRSLNVRLRNVFNAAVLESRLVRAGLSAPQVEQFTRPVEIEVVTEASERNNTEAFYFALAMIAVIYGMIIFYGNIVMRGVIEEKQSRIIEVLLSSVRPVELMLGKLIGIGLVSLTQVTIWVTASTLLSALSAAPLFALSAFKMPQLNGSTIVYFLIFFVLGYFLFSTFYLIAGALVSAEEDAQQIQMPIVLSAVIPMLLLESVLRQPNSAYAVTLSLVPIFSPILMFARIIAQPPPFWQIALCILLLLLTIAVAVWLAAKIYRVGILMYGKPPTLPELWKWLKYS